MDDRKQSFLIKKQKGDNIMFYINIDRTDTTPLYQQIYCRIKELIESGTMEPGFLLPPLRKLATDLKVGRNTVEHAYRQLESDGYIYSHIGSGFRVSTQDPLRYKTNSPRKISVPHSTASMPYDFAYTKNSSAVFPFKLWKNYMADTLFYFETSSSLSYPYMQGEPFFRETLAKFQLLSKGNNCDADQIVITNNFPYMIDFLSKLLPPTEYTIAIESPCYGKIKSSLELIRYPFISIPVEEDGVNITALEQSNANIVITTPFHQFPSGATLSLEKRDALLDWAKRKKGYIIEIDYEHELCFSGTTPPSLYFMDTEDRVIFTNDFSISLVEGMRVSYFILPKRLLSANLELFHTFSCPVPIFYQHAIATMIEDGNYTRHLNRRRTFYKRQHDYLISAIKTIFQDKAIIFGANGGSYIFLQVDTVLDQYEIIERALQKGVVVYPTRPFYHIPEQAPKSAILLGYISMSEKKIKEAITLLYKAIFE